MPTTAIYIGLAILCIGFCLIAYLTNRAVNEAITRIDKSNKESREKLKNEIKEEVLKELENS